MRQDGGEAEQAERARPARPRGELGRERRRRGEHGGEADALQDAQREHRRTDGVDELEAD
ncbi:MAG: hypothetical protein U0802_26235 [Candidatus Binatia bacterium]